MPQYYVNRNAQPDGYHEVHIDDNSCPTPPDTQNRENLGWRTNCSDAVGEAKRRYTHADGCENCVPTCHTR